MSKDLTFIRTKPTNRLSLLTDWHLLEMLHLLTNSKMQCLILTASGQPLLTV